MKKILLLFIVLFSITSFAQQQIILISNKYEFQKEPNSYNINNMLKAILVSNNYQVYFEDEVLPLEIAQNKCNALKGVLVDKSNVFLTKVKLQIKDCQNNLLFETIEVKSKEKDIQTGFIEVIKLLSSELKKYKPTVIAPKEVVVETKPVVEKIEVVETTNVITKRTFSNCIFVKVDDGFTILDVNQKQVLDMNITSNPNIFIAFKYGVTGVYTKFEKRGVFEYYFDGKLMTEEFLF